jgi:formamidopyrimidine-DNA glycosylase
MPSLPELEVYKSQFTTLLGQPVAAIEPLDYRVIRLDAKELEAKLVGHAFTRIDRYGKWLIWDFGSPEQLIIHLGLTGKLRLLDPADKTSGFSCFAIKFENG